jgi:hypothetical protein
MRMRIGAFLFLAALLRASKTRQTTALIPFLHQDSALARLGVPTKCTIDVGMELFAVAWHFALYAFNVKLNAQHKGVVGCGVFGNDHFTGLVHDWAFPRVEGTGF